MSLFFLDKIVTDLDKTGEMFYHNIDPAKEGENIRRK